MKIYLYAIFILTILLWLSFGATVILTDPTKAQILVFLAFFICLFLALTGSIGLLLFYLRLRFAKKGEILGHLKLSLRQAGLLSIFVIGLLVFSAFSILSIWTGSLLFVFIILLEFVLKAVK